MGKKQKRLAEAQANGMPLTRAQVVMRSEMLRAKDEDGRATYQPALFDDEIDDETPEQHEVGWQVGQTRNTEPMPLHQALDAILGVSHHPQYQDLALQIIDESPTLNLSLSQWRIVQGMVEKAVRVGFEYGGRAAR